MSAQPSWILLRGLMRDGRHWAGFPAQMAGSGIGAVTVLDLPGNGSRSAERSPACVTAMVEDLRGQLRERGLAPPYRLLAMSLGGMIATDWAARHAQELQAVVLINTSLRGFSPFYRRLQPAAYGTLLRLLLARPTAQQIETAILRLTACHPSRPAAAVLADWIAWRQAQPVSRGNALRQLLAALRFRAPALAPAVPMLVLAGAGDRLVHPACSQRLAEAWQCRFALHPSAGHDLPLDAPDWVLAQIRTWLERPPAPETASLKTAAARV